MILSCPKCGHMIDEENINIQSEIAKCGSCREVFSFAGKVAGPVGSPPKSKPRVDLPKNMTLTNSGTELILTHRWFSPIYFLFLFFCVFWDIVLLSWYLPSLTGKVPLILILFPLGHVAVGIYLTYMTLAGFLNRTIIRVSGMDLSIRHAPLPWRGNRTITRFDIDQLYCREEVRSGENGRRHSFYHLYLQMKNGKRIKLLSKFSTPDEPLFLEQEIEKYLGLKDRAMPGEMRFS